MKIHSVHQIHRTFQRPHCLCRCVRERIVGAATSGKSSGQRGLSKSSWRQIGTYRGHSGRRRVMCDASVHSGGRVTERMEECRQNQRIAFIPFLVAGDPSLEYTVKAIKALDAAGADVIELGVPYSDPLADGPTIQAAATRALQQGVILDKVIDVIRQVTPHISAPIVMFTYFNPIMARGLDRFCVQIKEAGASGLLVPDIPLEETSEIREVATSHGLDLVLLATPTTPAPRMKAIAEKTQGFVYLVSVTGVTGMRGATESRVEGLIKQLRETTDKSIAVGFGVSGPEQAKQIKDWGADGVIVGSALVKALGESSSHDEGLKAMTDLATSIRSAI